MARKADRRLPQNIRLGKRVAKLRAAKGLSQQRLADMCGYTRQMVCTIEAGRTAVSGPGRLALAAALGVRPETLDK